MLIFDNLRGKYFCQIKNLDIEISAHDALQELPLSGRLIIKRLENEIIWKYLGVSKQKGINRKAKIGKVTYAYGRSNFVLLLITIISRK